MLRCSPELDYVYIEGWLFSKRMLESADVGAATMPWGRDCDEVLATRPDHSDPPLAQIDFNPQ